MNPTKFCGTCKTEKPRSEFYKTRSPCKACVAAESKRPEVKAIRAKYDAARWVEKRDAIGEMVSDVGMLAGIQLDPVRAALKNTPVADEMPLRDLLLLAEMGNPTLDPLVKSFLALYPRDRFRLIKRIVGTAKAVVSDADIAALAPKAEQTADQK
jgi:hypothetical protein